MLTHLSHLRPLSAVNHGAVVDGEGVLPTNAVEFFIMGMRMLS